MIAQVFEGRHQPQLGAWSAAATDDAAARAEPAIDRAAIGREQECAIRVALDQFRRDLVRFLAQWIAQIAFDLAAFERVRHHLFPDRALFVVRIAQGQVVGRDRDRQAGALAASAPASSSGESCNFSRRPWTERTAPRSCEPQSWASASGNRRSPVGSGGGKPSASGGNALISRSRPVRRWLRPALALSLGSALRHRH